MAWRDIQRAHPSENAARAAAKDLKVSRWRIMRIAPEGRRPL